MFVSSSVVSQSLDPVPVVSNDRNWSSGYRYAFQGQERNGETGMEAFELRLWDGRLGRWLTVDPYHEFYSLYVGMGNNPISLTDPDGGMTDGGGNCEGCPSGWLLMPEYANSVYGPQQKSISPGFPGSNVPIELDTVSIVGKTRMEAGDQANNLMSTALTVAQITVPLDKYMYALSQNKFVYDFKGTDKFWSMNFNGGGRANISSSSIRSAKIETKLLGGIGNGLKYGGSVLSFYSFISTEIQYRNHYIDDNQLLKGRLDNTIGVLFPVAAIGTVPGNYLGEKYHREIMHEVSNNNSVTKKGLVKFLNFFGLPASQEQTQKGF